MIFWTKDEVLPELQRRIEERWQIDDIGVLSPDEEMEMHIAMLGLDKIHDRVLWVWWD